MDTERGLSMVTFHDIAVQNSDFGLRVLALLPANVFIHDLATGCITFSNRALSETLGYPDSLLEWQADGMANLMHPDDRQLAMQIGVDLSSISSPVELQCRLRHADGSWRWFGVRMVVFGTDSSDQPKSVLGVAAEITSIKRREEELEHQAGHDPLTGLPNRRQFLASLEAQFKSGSPPFTVVICDIDKFKEINDRYGHAAGDEVLRRFATLLSTGVRSADTVGRLGGDEFSLLLRNTSVSQCLIIIDRVRGDFSRHRFGAPPSEFSASASFGMAEFPAGLSASEILAKADERLYQAKRSGRNRVCG